MRDSIGKYPRHSISHYVPESESQIRHQSQCSQRAESGLARIFLPCQRGADKGRHIFFPTRGPLRKIWLLCVHSSPVSSLRHSLFSSRPSVSWNRWEQKQLILIMASCKNVLACVSTTNRDAKTRRTLCRTFTYNTSQCGPMLHQKSDV